jgi:uncharacterized protein (TIGR03000 family)
MLKNSLWRTTIAALVGAGLLLTPGISEAQRGGGGGGGGGRSSGGSWSRGGGGYGNYGRGGWNQGYGFGAYSGFGLGIYPGYYGAGAYGYAGNGLGYYDAPYGVPQSSYQSFYPPDTGNNPGYAPAPASNPSAASFVVRVPDPNAEIWFDNHQTQQRGTVREYESAALDPNGTYTFHLRARWMQNGRAVDQTRDVQARAGQQVTVNFSASLPENLPAAALPTPRSP